MPANDFDKNMQEQLDALRMQPNSGVWQQVAERLRRRKKKRYLIVFFSLATLLLLGYGVNYVLSPAPQNIALIKEKENIQSLSRKEEQTESKPTITEEKKIDERTMAEKEKEIKELDNKIVQDKQNEEIPTKASQTNDDSNKISNGGDRGIAKKENVNQYRKAKKEEQFRNMETTPEKQDLAHLDNENTNEKGEAAGIDKILSKQESVPRENSIAKTVLVDSLMSEKAIVVKDAAVDTLALQMSSPVVGLMPKESKQQYKRKIKWGITAGIGYSALTDDKFLSLPGNKSLDNLTADPSAYNSASPQVFYTTSVTKNIPAFALGISLELVFSKRSSVLTGLEYYYKGFERELQYRYVNNAYAGQSQANYYYRNAGPEKNITRFHFLEIPVTYQWKVTPRWKRSFNLYGGLSVAQLLAAASQPGDPITGGTYSSAINDWNKTQAYLQTGFSFTIPVRKLELYVGPHLSASMTPIRSHHQGKPQYLSYGGVRLRLIFPKK